MSSKEKNGPCVVKLPDNAILSRADLPPFDTVRWVVSRKIAVVRAVVYELMSLEESLNGYGISEEEFSLGSIWPQSMERKDLGQPMHKYIDNLKEK